MRLYRINFQSLAALNREEHSMDQYRSRLKLSENFERHWSIRISGEIHMDQSLVHTFSWGNLYGPMVLKVLQKFPPTLVLVHGWLSPVKYPLRRNYYQNNSVNIFSCNCPGAITGFSCRAPEKNSPQNSLLYGPHVL